MTKVLPIVVVSWIYLSITAGRAVATDKTVNEALDIKSSKIQTLGFAQGAEHNLTTVVEVDGKTWTLDLQRHSVRSPAFEVWVQDATGALTLVDAPLVQTYKGTVLELPGSEVRATYNDDELEAVVYTSEGIFGIQPLAKAKIPAPKGQHAVYKDSDWLNKRGYSCAADGVQHPFEGFAGLEEPQDEIPTVAAAGDVVAEIALDADFEFFQLNGGNVAATVQDMENVINGMQTIYQAQLGIMYEITSVIVRSAEPDPYTATNHSTLLSEFVTHWNAAPQSSIHRDLVHLFTGKNLDGSVIGVAYVGAVCNRPWAYGLSQSRFTASMTSRVALTAHEIGHNWNAQHCNGCTTCTDCCRIMCSGLGGCSGITNSFGCQEVAQIEAFRDTRTCLSADVPVPDCTTNADCNDGLYCTGVETCVSGSCQAGSTPNCSDAVACTADSCNETADRCDHVANNSLCGDGFFCNGIETCNPLTGCTAGLPPCAAGTCDESTDVCGSASDGETWLVFVDTAVVPGVGTVQNEDIVAFDSTSGTWSLVFDGSDVGLSYLAIDGMAVLPSGDILLSFSVAAGITGLTGGPSGTAIDDSDIIRFIPTSLGANTAGSFVFYFDGSDVGLVADGEDVDAISLTADGRLVLSTVGPFTVTGAAGDDKDLIVFSSFSLGAGTTGSFATYFDGSDVGLTTVYENVDGVSLSSNGNILLSTFWTFSVPGVNGADEDVLQFTPATLGSTTSGTYSMFLDLSAKGIATYENVNALELVE